MLLKHIFNPIIYNKYVRNEYKWLKTSIVKFTVNKSTDQSDCVINLRSPRQP